MYGIKALLLIASGALGMYSLMEYKNFTLHQPDIRYLLAAIIIGLIGLPYSKNKQQKKRDSIQLRVATGEFPSTAEQNDIITEFLTENQKINAIKYYREQTGKGLKDAKDYVEYIEQHMQGEHHAL